MIIHNKSLLIKKFFYVIWGRRSTNIKIMNFIPFYNLLDETYLRKFIKSNLQLTFYISG